MSHGHSLRHAVTGPGYVEALLRRDRLLVVTGLGVVIVASWAYILAGVGTGMSALEMTSATGSHFLGAGGVTGGTGAPADGHGAMASDAMVSAAWSAGYASLMFFMWWTMMIAMMLPSASPMILLYAALHRRERERLGPYVPTAFFALGYVLVWAGFGVLAVALQWSLQGRSLLSPAMASTSDLLGGGLLLGAGLYQLTPLKHACLRQCRSPVRFLSTHWRRGRTGALSMGLRHGTYCLGCCWVLMGLLFVGGVMNFYWVSGIAAYVLLEKTIPAGHWLGSALGLVLAAWGVVVMVGRP